MRQGLVILTDESIVGIVEVFLSQFWYIVRFFRVVDIQSFRRIWIVWNIEQPFVILKSLQSRGAACKERRGCLLRLLPLEEAHLLRHLLDLGLVSLANKRKMFGVALFQR